MRIIISPSGNLYGSENVLFDFLNQSSILFERIYVPENSSFYLKLKYQGFNCIGFKRTKILYFKLALVLLCSKVSVVYCNEGAHSKYINFLAHLFPNVKFILHVRISEDTSMDRLKGLEKNNVNIISISKNINTIIHLKNHLIYDGFAFKINKPFALANLKPLKIGIIGRITGTKGFDFFLEIYESLHENENIEFHFFGDIDTSVKYSTDFYKIQNNTNLVFHGFEKDKNKIYACIDILIHFNENEPLGRIFFESLDYGVPFIGINSGGIGEIASVIDYPYVFNKTEFQSQVLKFIQFSENFKMDRLETSREIAKDFFSIKTYTSKLEEFFK